MTTMYSNIQANVGETILDYDDVSKEFNGPKRIKYNKGHQSTFDKLTKSDLSTLVQHQEQIEKLEIADKRENSRETSIVENRIADETDSLSQNVTESTKKKVRKDIAVPADPSPTYLAVMRSHFVNDIVYDLGQLERVDSDSPSRTACVDSVLQSISRMRKFALDDVFSDLLLAFYDALTVDNKWTEYTNDQYGAARDLMIELSGRKNLREEAVDRALIKLEDIGFDTTPYSMEFSEDNDSGLVHVTD